MLLLFHGRREADLDKTFSDSESAQSNEHSPGCGEGVNVMLKRLQWFAQVSEDSADGDCSGREERFSMKDSSRVKRTRDWVHGVGVDLSNNE